MDESNKIIVDDESVGILNSQMGRRDFIKLLSLSLANLNYQTKEPPIKWKFLEQRHVSKDDISDLSELVRVGKEEDLAEDPNAIEIFNKYAPNATKVITISGEKYLVPGRLSVMEGFKSYCINAIHFLYKELPRLSEYNPDLSPTSINWVIPKEGDDFSVNYSEKAFLANNIVRYLTYKFINDKNEKLTMNLSQNMKSSSHFQLFCDEDFSKCDWYVILSSGLNSINAPFSEFVPVATKDMGQKLSGQVPYEEFIKLMEAFSEGVSILLGYKIADQLNIPNGKEIVENYKKKRAKYPVYEYVPGALHWMNQHGLEDSLDLYMNNPNLFLKEIKR